MKSGSVVALKRDEEDEIEEGGDDTFWSGGEQCEACGGTLFTLHTTAIGQECIYQIICGEGECGKPQSDKYWFLIEYEG